MVTKKVVAAVASAMVALCGVAAEFTLKSELSGTAFDWSQGTSYEGGLAPSSSDAFVNIPAGMEAKLSASDTTSWAFVNGNVARICPLAATSRLEVEVASGQATLMSEVCVTNKSLNVAVNGGVLAKTGAGELVLGASDPYGYYAHLAVEAGTLTLYPDGLDTKYNFVSLSVAKDTLLNTVGGDGITVCRTFSGEGTINGTGSGALQTISSSTATSVFPGKFTGFGTSFLKMLSPVMLTGTNSTATGVVSASGPMDSPGSGAVLGLARFGKTDDASGSVGLRREIQIGDAYPGGVLYLGKGESSNMKLNMRGTSAGTYAFLDAGATGGLELSGATVETGTKSAAMHREFILTGSNTVPCVFGLRFVERWDGADPANWCPFHVVKQGTGTWRMKTTSANSTALSGGISVENGVLQYDSLAAAGTYCALGYGTHRYERFTGTVSSAHEVDWAISLGTADGTEGTLEYTGTDAAFCDTRLLALKGDGRLLHNSACRFRFKGITSDGANAKTLTLDGTGANDNEILGLSDAGGGAISVTKKGAGTWILASDAAFRGALNVQTGLLKVRAAASSYTWFRFTDMQVCTNRVGYDPATTPSPTFYMREMGFFNAAGKSQTIGLQFNANWREVNPGEFTYAKDATATASASNPWSALFDDTAAYCSVTLPSAPVYGDESTWMPLVFRMPEDADPIASFDLVWNTSASGAGALYHPAAFKMEGSVDGFTWTELLVTNGVVSPGSGYWLQSRTAYSGGDLATKTHTGFTFALPAVGANPLASATVSVAPDAVLKAVGGTVGISAFAIDMTAGGGTVDGFAFAADGALKMVNVPDGKSAEVSFTPLNCTGVENLSNWTLYVDGAETTKCHAYVTSAGAVRIMPTGFRITIR